MSSPALQQIMQLPGGMDADAFLKNYWQKQPLLVRQALPDAIGLLTPEELAGLALEEGVESRLILETAGSTPWELRTGPFSEKTFQQLPATHWTLLVQAVDHYAPEIASLLDRFAFIPGWRVDDIMISYAPQGGSVGPHYDQYDVFLIQLQGERHWQIGPVCDENTARMPHEKLRLLADMPVSEEWTLSAGDMLYLPPGMAHNGVAQNDCLTLSIGFRAPSLSRMLEHFTDHCLQRPGIHQLYADPDLQPQTHSGAITPASLARVKAMLQALIDDEAAFSDWFARFASEPKYLDHHCEADEELSARQWQKRLHSAEWLHRDGGSRFVYTCDNADHVSALYINSECHCLANPTQQQLARALCDQHSVIIDDILRTQMQAETEWLKALHDQGLLWLE